MIVYQNHYSIEPAKEGFMIIYNEYYIIGVAPTKPLAVNFVAAMMKIMGRR